MLCPFCLAKVKFGRERERGGATYAYLCPECNEQVPAMYVQDYRRYPPVVVSAVGFRQHGKTVFLASLFYALKKLRLPQYWPTFFTMALDEDSLDTVYGNVELLERGELPDSTPKNFPRPTILRIEDLPLFRQMDWNLLCYDTGGESFERPTQMVQFAGFVRRAKTAMLLISVTDLADPAKEMHRLLNTYIVGMGELGARTQDQHLVVVYTKADRMAARVQGWDQDWRDLQDSLVGGSIDSLARPRRYMKKLGQISRRLREFTLEKLRAHEFLNATQFHFQSVAFSMVSALGADPDHGRMPVRITPRRVLDPLLWMIEKSQGWW